MRFVFDVVHPAHVHFYKHLIADLERDGHQTLVVARHKDVTIALLEAEGIDHEVVERPVRRGRLALASELVWRDLKLAHLARRFAADAILTRNPAGVHAAKLARIPGIFDTDDGSAVGVHFRSAAPFATVITSPDCLPSLGPRHHPYPSFKPLAFLHPNRFSPDPSVIADLGLAPGELYFVVRLVALVASHDRNAAGLSREQRTDVVRGLTQWGRVFITSESPLDPELRHYALPTAAHRLHDVIAHSALVVTDGQSVAGEAAVLGVPSVRLSSSAGNLDVFGELSSRYDLVAEFQPRDYQSFLDRVEKLAANPWSDEVRRAHRRLLRDKCDLTTWMAERVEGFARR